MRLCLPRTLFNVALAALAFSFTSFTKAAFNGSISFTQQERDLHLAVLPQLLVDAGNCLKADLDYHHEFYARYGISPFYGDQSNFGIMSYSDKKAYLKRIGINPNLLSQLQPTSCVGMTLKCVGGAFQKNGEADYWARIKNFLDANGVDGTALQEALQQLGWKILYWNPDTAQDADWDYQEQSRNFTNSNRFWGAHAYHWTMVQREPHGYDNNRVDDWDLLVNFRLSPPLRFQQIPFFVGTAHGGYHVFSGLFGEVIEGHSMRSINDPNTIESGEFNPLAIGGSPKGPYFSGLAAVPPGY